jgi:hypothetical protein
VARDERLGEATRSFVKLRLTATAARLLQTACLLGAIGAGQRILRLLGLEPHGTVACVATAVRWCAKQSTDQLFTLRPPRRSNVNAAGIPVNNMMMLASSGAAVATTEPENPSELPTDCAKKLPCE